MNSTSPYWRKHGTSVPVTICCEWWWMPTANSAFWRQPRRIIPRDDLRALPTRTAPGAGKTAAELSYRVLPADQWPLFELVVSEIDDCVAIACT